MNNCHQCNLETKNPKFCNKSCAAKFNNKIAPKRYKTNRCKTCKKLIWRDRTYCQECWNNHKRFKWKKKTLGELKTANANQGGYPMIRADSRRKYLASEEEKKCLVCNYNLHIEICHIKDIKDFNDEATINEINDMNNLIALCRNHHWEFDNGYLNLFNLTRN